MMSAPIRERFPDLSNGRRVLFGVLAIAATPEQELTVSEWADRYRKISAESGSPFPGDWSTSRVPYLREMQDCLHPDHPARRVTARFSAQCGKSEVHVNWFGFIVDRAPGSIMMVFPSLDEATKFNRVKLQTSIDASPQIRHRVRPENSRDEASSTTSFKRFAGGFAQIVTASSSKGLQMVSIRYLGMDEVSEYPLDTDGRGSPIEQARARQKAFGDLAKEYACSTPGTMGDCRISAMFEDGDRRFHYLPFPCCGSYQRLRFEHMQAPSEMTRGRVTFACQACGELVDQVSRTEMLAKGRWVPTRVEIGDPEIPDVIEAAEIDRFAVAPCSGRVRSWQPSYAMWSAYSPFEAWLDIWNRYVASKGDALKEKAFKQQDLGEPYDPTSDAPDHEKLLKVRRFWKKGVVPYPVAALTGMIDVQGSPARFEWGVWGWAPGFQGYLVDAGIIPGPIDGDEAWAAIDALVSRQFPTDAGRLVPPIAWGMDTGFSTQLLYDRLTRRGTIAATKGLPESGKPPVHRTVADLKDEFGRRIAGRKITLALLGTFDLKTSVYSGLRNLVAGPDASGNYPRGTLHLPDWIGEDYLKQITAETCVDPREQAKGNAKRALLQKPGERREWVKRPHAANEALDIVVGARALAWEQGAGSIDAQQWANLVADLHRPSEAHEVGLFAPQTLETAAEQAKEPEKPTETTEQPLRPGWFTHSGESWFNR